MNAALNQAVLFLPNLVAALGLALLGLVLAGLARERSERAAYQMDLGGPVGPVSQRAVLVVFGIMALAQLGVPTTILTVLATVVGGGAALTVALAFGLGGRDVARNVSAGRYVSDTFRIGQSVRLGDIRGEITAIDRLSTVLRGEDGQSLHVPHRLFLESVVATDG